MVVLVEEVVVVGMLAAAAAVAAVDTLAEMVVEVVGMLAVADSHQGVA